MLRSSKEHCFEVMVVDDDKVALLLHKNQLGRSHIEQPPVLCSDGKIALEYLQKKDDPKRHFLVLLDLNMPVLNGWEFLESLKNGTLKANVYVVIVTSSVFKEDYVKAMQFEHVIGFCSKPLNPHDMQEIKSLEKIRDFFSNQDSLENIPSEK